MRRAREREGCAAVPVQPAASSILLTTDKETGAPAGTGGVRALLWPCASKRERERERAVHLGGALLTLLANLSLDCQLRASIKYESAC